MNFLKKAMSQATASSSALWAAKQQLRGVMKQRLAVLSPESIAAQSLRVCETLKSFKPYQDARTISIFLSMPGGEIQTEAIVRDALAAGKAVFVPYLHRSPLPAGEGPARVMDMVQLRDDADYDSLARDRWGIPSVDGASVHARRRILGGPDELHSPSATLDMLLMPGVAFDVDGRGDVRRLGHGKGFYDFFVHRYLVKMAEQGGLAERKAGDMVLYGLGLREQFLDRRAGPSGEEVPVGPLDQGLHGLVLGDGSIVTSRDRGSTTICSSSNGNCNGSSTGTGIHSSRA